MIDGTASAGTAAAAAGTPGRTLRGRTDIHPRALRALGTALAAESAGVRPRDVALALGDRAGRLVVELTVPAVIGGSARTTLPARAAVVRRRLRDGMSALAARDVAAVDVRFDGVRHDGGGRVS